MREDEYEQSPLPRSKQRSCLDKGKNLHQRVCRIYIDLAEENASQTYREVSAGCDRDLPHDQDTDAIFRTCGRLS